MSIIQDVENDQVLMVAYMNREALKRTLEGPYVTFWTRSRQKFWVKGETSGHTQQVKEVIVDCDVDAILIKVAQNVAACHAGYRSYFYREVKDGDMKIIAETVFEPTSSS